MNKLSTIIGATALLASGSASAIVVDGVDFGAAGQLGHLETTTLASTFINGTGQTLFGYGQVNTVNGNSNYASGNRLYFTFQYDVTSFSNTAVGFSNGQANFYLGSLSNLLNSDSATNVSNIQGLSSWANFAGVADASGNDLNASGTFAGASLSFASTGLLEVVGGSAAVVNFLDSNGIATGTGGFADAAIATSGNNFLLNANDDTTGCTTGQATVGQWCLAGSADIRGLTSVSVPEPSSVALLGMGLIGFGASSLRKKKSA